MVLGESLHITSEYLTHKAKIVLAVSKVEALKVENYKLKKDLISAIDETNTIKKKVKVLRDDLRAERQLTPGEIRATPSCEGEGKDCCCQGRGGFLAN